MPKPPLVTSGGPDGCTARPRREAHLESASTDENAAVRHLDAAQQSMGFGTGSEAALPLAHDGRWLGNVLP